MTGPNVYRSDWDVTFSGVGMASITRPAGAELLGATVYELEPGAKWADLHIHYANEEMIVVLAGAPTLHTLEESRELSAGEVVVCLRGRRGAHRLENASDELVRVIIVSTMLMPELVEYPERDHLFAMTEAPYTEGANDPVQHGRILRVFDRAQGRPVPPDSK